MSFAVQTSFSGIAEIPTIFDVAVSDTTSIISTNLTTLQSPNVISITADAPLTLTITEFVQNLVSVKKMTSGIIINATSSEIISAMTGLSDNADKITSIVSSISVSYSLYSTYARALNKCTQIAITDVPCIAVQAIMTASVASVTVTDTYANITAYSSVLTTYASRITNTNNTSILTVDNFKTVNFATTTEQFKLSDTGAQISSNISLLNSRASFISQLQATSVFTLSYATWQASTNVLAKLAPSDYVSVSGVPASATSSLRGTITISDTATQITQYLPDIISYASIQGNLITAIQTTTNENVSVDSAIYVPNIVLMKKITFVTGYKLLVTGIKCLDLDTVYGSNAPVNSLYILDTRENIINYKTIITGTLAAIAQITSTDEMTVDASFVGIYPTLCDKVTKLIVNTTDPNGAYNPKFTYNVTLTATVQNANLNLFTNAPLISTITWTGSGSYPCNVDNILTTLTTLVPKLPASFLAITDSASTILTNYTNLNTIYSQIKSINFGTNSLTITQTQFLLPLTSTIAQNFKVSSVNCAMVSSVFANQRVTSITVVDTAAGLQPYFDYIVTVASKIQSLTISGTLVLTCAQFLNNLSFVLALPNLIRITDVSANFNLYAINAIVTNLSRITSITCTDTLVLDYTIQYAPYLNTFIPKVNTAYQVLKAPFSQAGHILNLQLCTSVAIYNTISNDIYDLNYYLTNYTSSESRIASITWTLGLANSTLTYSKFLNLQLILQKLVTPTPLFTVTASVQQLGIVMANSAVNRVSVSDSFSNFLAYFDTFAATVASGKNITLGGFSDYTSTKIILSIDQYISCKSLFDSYAVRNSSNRRVHINPLKSSTNRTLAEAASFVNLTKIQTVTVSDTSTEINNALVELYAMYPVLVKITPTTPLTIPMATIAAEYGRSVQQYESFKSFLQIISGTFTAGNSVVANILARGYISEGAPTTNSVVAIADTTNIIQSNFNKFYAKPTNYVSISVTDAPSSFTFTATQATAGKTFIDMIKKNGCPVTISQVPCNLIAQLSPIVSFIQVSDTSANVSAYMATIQTYLTQITTLTVTDATTSTPFSFTYSLFTSTSCVAAFYSLTQVPFANATSLLTSSTLKTLQISDIASNFIVGLLSNTKVTSVTIEGTVDMTSEIFTANLSYISKLPSGCVQLTTAMDAGTFLANISYFAPSSLSALNATVAQVPLVAATGATMTVSDSATAIDAAIETLESLSDQITSITATGTISLDKTQLNYAIVDFINSPFTVTDTLQVAQLSSVANTNITGISILDSADNILRNFELLQNSAVLSVSSETPLELTYTQSSSTLASKITSFFVTNVLISQTTLLLANQKVAGVTVLDSSSAISTGIQSGSLGNVRITSVTPSDESAILVPATAFLTASSSILKLSTQSISISNSSPQFIRANLLLLKSCDAKIKNLVN